MTQNSLGVRSGNRHDSFGRRVTARAAILAAAFCLFASMATAGPITCAGGQDTYTPDGGETRPFIGHAFHCESVPNSYSEGQTSQSQTYVFNFGNFTNTLEFDRVLQDMSVTMSAFFVLPGNLGFLSRIPSGFVPETFFTSFGESWIYFRVEDLGPTSGPPVEGVHYDGNWTQTIVWLGDGNYVDPQVLHDARNRDDDRTLDDFADIITVDGSFDPCPPDFEGEDCLSRLFAVKTGGPIDPTIAGTALDFSDTTVVDTVPEPSSLLLLGAGLSGFVYRRRRQRSAAARVESA